LPSFGSPPRLGIWAQAAPIATADDLQTGALDAWALGRGVRLDLHREGTPDLERHLGEAASAGTLPDLAILDAPAALRLSLSIRLRDAAELLQAATGALGDPLRPADCPAQRGDSTPYLPLALEPTTVVYGPKLLTAAPARTWPTLLDQLKGAQRPPQFHGLGLAINRAAPATERALAAIARGHGAALVDGAGRPAVSRPALTAFLRTIVRAADLGLLRPGIARWGTSDTLAALSAGRIALTLGPSTLFGRIPPGTVAPAAAPPAPNGSPADDVRIADALVLLTDAPLGREAARALVEPGLYRCWTAALWRPPAYAGATAGWQDELRRALLDAARLGAGSGLSGPSAAAEARLEPVLPLLGAVLRVMVDRWTVDQAVDELDRLVARTL
jgi:hypothetical protein